MQRRKEASGLRLFHWLHGVQVVAGSNPATPTSKKIHHITYAPKKLENIIIGRCFQFGFIASLF